MSSWPSPGEGVTASAAPGKRLGDRYVLDAPIASGGMAQVWAGTDETLGRKVAIKLLHPHLATDEAFVARFRREAVAAASLSHRTIVSVYDTVSSDGVEAFVMELIEGRTLRAVLDEIGTMSEVDAVHLGVQIASALDVAHSAGIVHRDIKPANIMIGPSRRVKVTDFGIAKAGTDADLTATGTLLGTAKYLSPEQVTGAALDPRSDLYALGVVLFEALTGSVPFKSTTDAATALARLHQEAPPLAPLRPDVSPALAAVVARCMAREPDGRYRTARDLRDALAALAPGSLDDLLAEGVLRTPDPDRPVPPHPSTATRSTTPDPDRPVPPHPSTATIGVGAGGEWGHATSFHPDSDPTALERRRPDGGATSDGQTRGIPASWPAPSFPPVSPSDGLGDGGTWDPMAGTGPDAHYSHAYPPDAPRPDPAGRPGVDLAGPAGDRSVIVHTRGVNRILAVAVGALVLTFVVLVVLLALRAGGSDDPSSLGGEAAAEETQPVVEPVIAGVTSFDPQTSDAVKEENEDEVGLAVDGDPSTAWPTSTYKRERMAGLKDGVGLILELEEAVPLEGIDLSTPNSGWSAEIYLGDDFSGGPGSWGEPVAAVEGVDGDQSIDLDGAESSRILIWLRDTGTTDGEFRFELREVTVR